MAQDVQYMQQNKDQQQEHEGTFFSEEEHHVHEGEDQAHDYRSTGNWGMSKIVHTQSLYSMINREVYIESTKEGAFCFVRGRHVDGRYVHVVNI